MPHTIIGWSYAPMDSATGYATTCVLHESKTRSDAIAWANEYCRGGNMGGWDEVHVYGRDGAILHCIMNEPY